MHCVTKAMPSTLSMASVIAQKLKSCRTCLTNHTGYLSNHIMTVVINALEQTLRYTCTQVSVDKNNFKKLGMHHSQASTHLVKNADTTKSISL